jgi:N-acetylglutamate synthase-like GNAT family acetyltransferase
MNNKIKSIIKKIIKEELNLTESFNTLNNPINSDYSGKYESLYQFIQSNDLQQVFVNKYNQYDSDLSIDNWEDFVRGEMGSDEEIIERLLDDEYKIFYDEDEDVFIVIKKKRGKLKYKIKSSNSNEIIRVLEKSGINSEYKPRFVIILNENIIGGSTYYIDDDNVYNFDIGILDDYQGYGISKNLIDVLIYDAKKLNAKAVKAQIVNNMLFEYLIKIGFEYSKDNGIKYVYKNI